MSTEDEYAPISSLAQVRGIARTIQMVHEIYLNEKSRLVSFSHSFWNSVRINVYYTTGTVGICAIHPVTGKVQQFRNDVNCMLLKTLLTNPRLIYSLGYRKREERAVGIKRKVMDFEDEETNLDDDEVEDEETELRKQLGFLGEQVYVIKTRLKAIETKRKKEQKRIQEEQERVRLENLRRKAESEQREAEEAARLAHVEQCRISNLRGNSCDWCLDYSDNMPESMLDVSCVAIAEGGFIAVHDSGSCTYHGIPYNVISVIKQQQNSMISYIALGEYNQYYIHKTNGKELYNGCEEFIDAIENSSSAAKLVAFGDYNTYFIEFIDGSRAYSSNLYDRLSSDAYSILLNTKNSIHSVWLGDYDCYSSEYSYFIVYNNGNYIYDKMPEEVFDWFEYGKQHTVKVKQVLIGNDGNYFVRFS